MAQNAFVQSIKVIAESLIHNAGFDKTRSGKIVGKNELTNSYSVKVDGHVYPNVRAVNDIKYNIGDIVKINIPVGQMSQAYISSSTFSDASIGKKIGHAEALIDAIDGSLEEVTEIDGHIYQIDITSMYGEESSAHTGHIYKDGTDVTDATYWNKFRWYLLTSSGKERQTDGVSNATLTMGIDRYLYGMSLILEWVDSGESVLLRKNIVLVSNEKIADVETYASNAYELANNTDNYFWHVESGDDTGAHITNQTKDHFQSATTDSARGYNFLAKPEGVALRYGYTELGHFTANGVDFQAYQNGTLYKTAELTANALNFYYLGRKMADMSATGVKFYDGEANPTEIASFSKDALSFNSAVPFSIGNGSRYIQWTGSGLNIITDTLFIGNSDISTTISQAASATYRATCSTASSTKDKTATCAGFTLTAGATIALYMTQANTTTDALTLNINGTGAKAIYVNGTATGADNQLLWSVNATVTFTYNGTYWYVADGAGTLYGSTCSTNASTASKTTTVESVAIFRGVSIVVPMTNDNTNTSATLNVSSLGARNIYYGDTTTCPTTANKYGWTAGSTAFLTFDGKNWRLDGASASKKASDAASLATDAYDRADTAYLNAEDAKKVATNYMYFDGTGLRIASSSPSDRNSRMYITNSYISMYDSNAKRRFHITSSTLTLGRNDADGNRYAEITDSGGLYLKYRADSSHTYTLADFTTSGMTLRNTSGITTFNAGTNGMKVYSGGSSNVTLAEFTTSGMTLRNSSGYLTTKTTATAFTVYDGTSSQVQLASFSSTGMTLKNSSGYTLCTVGSNGMTVNNSSGTQLANFGATATIGATSGYHLTADPSNGFMIKDSSSRTLFKMFGYSGGARMSFTSLKMFASGASEDTPTINITSSGMYVLGAINSTGNINAGGSVKGSSLSITSGGTIKGGATINGGATITGGMNASGDVTVGKLYVSTPGTASSSTANCRIATGESNRIMFTGSSSREIKHAIKSVTDNFLDPHKLYDAEVVQFIYNLDYLNKNDVRYDMPVVGFIAEDLYKVYPVAVDFEHGKPHDWNYRYIIPPMLALIQEQKKELDKIGAELAEIRKKLYAA